MRVRQSIRAQPKEVLGGVRCLGIGKEYVLLLAPVLDVEGIFGRIRDVAGQLREAYMAKIDG